MRLRSKTEPITKQTIDHFKIRSLAEAKRRRDGSAWEWGPRELNNRDIMQLGKVVGNVVLNNKNETLSGVPLLLVQPISSAREPVGRVIVAADSVGAGVGEHVFFVRGKEASFPFYPTEVPADAGIVGIVDHWTVG